jgi:hypothetical protein
LQYVVPVAVNCSYCTPDDRYGKYQKHVEWSCNKNKILVLHLFGHFMCIHVYIQAVGRLQRVPPSYPKEDLNTAIEIVKSGRMTIYIGLKSCIKYLKLHYLNKWRDRDGWKAKRWVDQLLSLSVKRTKLQSVLSWWRNGASVSPKKEILETIGRYVSENKIHHTIQTRSF